MKLGCGYPMGPLTLLDFVGLDTTYYIANIMFEEFSEPMFAAPPLLKRMVLAGTTAERRSAGSTPTESNFNLSTTSRARWRAHASESSVSSELVPPNALKRASAPS